MSGKLHADFFTVVVLWPNEEDGRIDGLDIFLCVDFVSDYDYTVS